MRSLSLIALGLGLALSACAPGDSTVSADRVPLGKADNTGSCFFDDGSTNCSDQSDGTCWCDDLCVDFGDCCEDRADACEPSAPPTLGCGDGTVALCEVLMAPCPDGLTREVVGSCFGECVDPETCEPPMTACEAATDALHNSDVADQTFSCTEDAECGQVLTGTSCGCTRNRVARLDADAGPWLQLLQKFNDACGGLISTCDCPAADGFACVEGSCTWNYL